MSVTKCDRCKKRKKVNDLHMPFTRAVHLYFCNDCLKTFLAHILTEATVAQKDKWIEDFDTVVDQRVLEFYNNQRQFDRAGKELLRLMQNKESMSECSGTI
jgi:transposase-like protein